MALAKLNGDVFEAGSDWVDVTSLHRPDTNWRVVDAHGHEHRWYIAGLLGVPALSYSPSTRYETPTLVVVHDGWDYDEDGERYAITHIECSQCRERIEPGYTSDTTPQYIPGLRWCRINGKSVTLEEFERRLAEAQG